MTFRSCIRLPLVQTPAVLDADEAFGAQERDGPVDRGLVQPVPSCWVSSSYIADVWPKHTRLTAEVAREARRKR